MLNVYEQAARSYWAAYLPEHVAGLDDPDAFFATFGERFLETVAAAMMSTGPRSIEGESAEQTAERLAPLLFAARVAIAATEIPSAPLPAGEPAPTDAERFSAWVQDVSRFVVLLDSAAVDGDEPSAEAVQAIAPRVAELLERAFDPAP